jgi:lysozyme family protein
VKTSYATAIAAVLEHEGGYSDDEADAGGPTKYGITHIDLAKWRGKPVTAKDVQKMTLAEAKAIYRAKYWDALLCDDLPKGVDYAVFDFGVNSGISRSAKYVQRIVGVAADGIIGPVTAEAIGKYDPKLLINQLLDRREEFLTQIIQNNPSQRVFQRGWFRRTKEVRQRALEMAA